MLVCISLNLYAKNSFYKHRWALSPISVISDIGLSLILELRHPILNRQAQQLSVITLASQSKESGFESAGSYLFFSSMSNIGINSDVDIGTLPISE
jgi:hypothetical protein